MLAQSAAAPRGADLARPSAEYKLTYTVAEVCNILGIGKTRFYQLMNAGQIEVRKLGSRSLVPAESLKAFIAALPKAEPRPRAA